MIYLSGPISAKTKKQVQKNKERFFEVQKKLEDDGYLVINPVERTETEHSWEWFMAKSVIRIFIEYDPDLKHYLDFVTNPSCKKANFLEFYFLKGWKKSLGARLEHEIAKRLKVKIKYEK